MEGWMTLGEAAVSLGRTVEATRNYRRFCGLPATKVGRQWLVKTADVDEWRRRPEIAAMLAEGDRMLATRRANLEMATA